jgi:7,8-dihydro-6-hydroxymethylpterin-pyrophosphokinase
MTVDYTELEALAQAAVKATHALFLWECCDVYQTDEARDLQQTVINARLALGTQAAAILALLAELEAAEAKLARVGKHLCTGECFDKQGIALHSAFKEA